MFEFGFAAFLISGLVALLTILGKRRPPSAAGFVYHLFLNGAAMGFAWGAANAVLSRRIPDGWFLLFALIVVIPSILLLGVALAVGLKTKRAREGWGAALALNGLTFGTLLALVYATGWDWWYSGSWIPASRRYTPNPWRASPRSARSTAPTAARSTWASTPAAW